MSRFHDRRGFNLLLQGHLALALLSLILMPFVSWIAGLALFLYACIAFVVAEAISAPPLNHPRAFYQYMEKQPTRKPVLLCLGDSLTHGNASANWTGAILPERLAEALGKSSSIEKVGTVFREPLWVVNAGQNKLTSAALHKERVEAALEWSAPDFVVVLVGTNDVLSATGLGPTIQRVNNMQTPPTIDGISGNLQQILQKIHKASPLTKVGICTLPPIGEDLQSEINTKYITTANDRIRQVVDQAGTNVQLVPLYDKLEAVIEKTKKSQSMIPLALFPLVTALQGVGVYLGGLSWNALSVGTVLSDHVHLNERGRDIMVEAVIEWLIAAGVTKAIAVKS